MPGRQQEFDNSGSRLFFRKGSRPDVRFVVIAFDFRLRSGPFEGPATVKASGFAGGSLLEVVPGGFYIPGPIVVGVGRTGKAEAKASKGFRGADLERSVLGSWMESDSWQSESPGSQ